MVTDFERAKEFLSSLGVKYQIVKGPEGKTLEFIMGYSGSKGVFTMKSVMWFSDNGDYLDWRLCG